MNGYLTKPVTSGELLAILSRWLPGSAKHAPPPDEPSPSPGRTDETAVFDHAAFHARFLHDKEIVADVLRVALACLPEHIRKFAEHIENRDYSAAETEAHTAKGTALNIGANQLAFLAADLERAAREKQHDRMAARLEQIKTAYSHFLDAAEPLHPDGPA